MRYPIALVTRRRFLAAGPAAALAGCGYHVAGRGDLLPRTMHTVAIPEFGNNTILYKLTQRLPQAIAREFISRTRYQVVPKPDSADAILRGLVRNSQAFPTTFDTATGRASGVQISLFLDVRLTERESGRILYQNPNLEVRERYEISLDQVAYFEESEPALERLSTQAARTVVTAILEAF